MGTMQSLNHKPSPTLGTKLPFALGHSNAQLCPLFLLSMVFKASRPQQLGFAAAALMPAKPPALEMWKNWNWETRAPSPLFCTTTEHKEVQYCITVQI